VNAKRWSRRPQAPLVLVLAAVAATFAPGSAIAAGGSIEISAVARQGNELRVEGTATFVDQPFVVLGTDPEGDGPIGQGGPLVRAAGADLTAISARTTLDGKVFMRWTLSEFPPFDPDGAPGIYYSWRLCLEGGSPCREVVAHSMRATSQEFEGVGSVWRCGSYICNSQEASLIRADIPVTFDRSSLTVTASLEPADFGAELGSTIVHQGEFASPVALSWIGDRGSGHPPLATRVDQLGDSPETAPKEYAIGARRVSLAIGPAGLAPETVSYRVTVEPSGDGAFSGWLDVEDLSGPHTIYARACFGTDNCAYTTTDVALG